MVRPSRRSGTRMHRPRLTSPERKRIADVVGRTATRGRRTAVHIRPVRIDPSRRPGIRMPRIHRPRLTNPERKRITDLVGRTATRGRRTAVHIRPVRIDRSRRPGIRMPRIHRPRPINPERRGIADLVGRSTESRRSRTVLIIGWRLDLIGITPSVTYLPRRTGTRPRRIHRLRLDGAERWRRPIDDLIETRLRHGLVTFPLPATHPEKVKPHLMIPPTRNSILWITHREQKPESMAIQTLRPGFPHL